MESPTPYSACLNSFIVAGIRPESPRQINNSNDTEIFINDTKKSFENTGVLFESVSHALSIIHNPSERNRYIEAVEREFDDLISTPIYKPFREFFRKERAKNNAAMEALSYFDDLTGGVRKDYYKKNLTEVLGRTMRTRSTMSLVYLDIDFFKKVNDTYGHHTGDIVLSSIGQIIVNHLRDNDVFVRNGGEEFAIILPNTSFDNAKIVLKRIQQAIKNHTFQSPEHKVFSIKTSSGLVTFENKFKNYLLRSKSNSIRAELDEKASELSNIADLLLYEVKANGRDGYASLQLASHSKKISDLSDVKSYVFLKTAKYEGNLDDMKNPSLIKKIKAKFKKMVK